MHPTHSRITGGGRPLQPARGCPEAIAINPCSTPPPIARLSREFWDLAYDQLDQWDSYSKGVLHWIHARLQAGLLDNTDETARVAHTAMWLPNMDIPSRTTMYTLTAPVDPALTRFRHDYFAHWPQDLRDDAQFAWVLGDGNCLLNAIVMGVAQWRPYQPGVRRAGSVPGVLTLRLALLLSMLGNIPKAMSLPHFRGCDAKEIFLSTASDGAWLGTSHAVFLADIIGRHI